MKRKIVFLIAIVAILAVATISVALADNGDTMRFGGMMGYSGNDSDEDWWTDMREHMDDHMDEVQDESWFDEMSTYMDEHMDNVENQDWFDEMTQYMEEENNNGDWHGGCH